jgi:hypothetical protein
MDSTHISKVLRQLTLMQGSQCGFRSKSFGYIYHSVLESFFNTFGFDIVTARLEKDWTILSW